MSVTKKPSSPKSVEEFIHSSPTATTNQTELSKKESSRVPVQLRVPDNLLGQIDDAVAKRQPAPSRHQWILEAIYDKLGRDFNN